MDQARHFEIAMVGDFQCGKSTTFNAILGRRELSPCGVGIKTSACAVTARALGPNEAKEYAEPVWRSLEWLDSLVRDIRKSDSEAADSQDLSRVATLIERFGKAPQLQALRQKRSVDIETARRWVAYPRDWELRWLASSDGRRFVLAEILPVFLERMVFHVRSSVLAEWGCDLTDAPGFGAGAWDEMLSREVMVRADLLVCVLDGRQSTLSRPCLDELSWLLRAGFASKTVFAQNGENGSGNELFMETNLAALNQRGFDLARNDVVLYCAKAAFDTEGNDVRLNRLLEQIIEKRTMPGSERAPWEGKIGVDEHGHIVPAPGYAWANGETLISRLVQGVRWCPGLPSPRQSSIVAAREDDTWQPLPGYLWTGTRNRNVRKTFASGAIWMPNVPHPELAHVETAQQEGRWEPQDGYEWRMPSTDETKMRHGVRWCPGLECKSTPHVIAIAAEGRFQPAPGYDWVDASSVETMWAKGVCWMSRRLHPDYKHVMSSYVAGNWIPEAGYVWASGPDGDMNARATPTFVRWKPGLSHPDHSHVVASDSEGAWRPESGWHFKNPNVAGDFQVKENLSFGAEIARGAGIGAGVGTIIPGIGTVVGGIWGALAGAANYVRKL